MAQQPIAIPATARPLLSARARLQTDKPTGRPVLLYPEGALFLNPTAHAVVLLCDGQQTLEQILSNLATRYHQSTTDLAPQVAGFLKQLQARNLLHGLDVLVD